MKAKIIVDLPEEITPEKITHVCGAFWYKVNDKVNDEENDEERDFKYCTAEFELIEEKQNETAD